MARSTSITLNDRLADFVDRQVTEGRFGTAGEVIQAGLRLLEEHEERLAALRSARAAGERSVPAVPFDYDAFPEERRGQRHG